MSGMCKFVGRIGHVGRGVSLLRACTQKQHPCGNKKTCYINSPENREKSRGCWCGLDLAHRASDDACRGRRAWAHVVLQRMSVWNRVGECEKGE